MLQMATAHDGPGPGPTWGALMTRRAKTETETHANFAYYMARRWHRRCPWADRDDLVQEALLGMWHAEQTYDEDKGKFVSWAGYQIRHRIKRWLNYKARVVHTPESTVKEEGWATCTSLDPWMDNEHTPDDLQLEVPDYDDALVVQAELARLTEHERQAVIARYWYGYTYVEMSEMWGSTKQAWHISATRGQAKLGRSAVLRREYACASGVDRGLCG